MASCVVGPRSTEGSICPAHVSECSFISSVSSSYSFLFPLSSSSSSSYANVYIRTSNKFLHRDSSPYQVSFHDYRCTNERELWHLNIAENRTTQEEYDLGSLSELLVFFFITISDGKWKFITYH